MRRALLLTAILSGLGCDDDPRPPESPEPSPNAALLPAPLTGKSRPDKDEDEGPIPAVPLPPEEALPLDSTTPIVALPSSGVSFTLRFSPQNWPITARLPSGEHEKLDLTLDFEVLSFPSGLERMRVKFPKGGWLLPEGTELRARTDRLGHILVWPDDRSYRVVPVGGLLTLLVERRVDVMPRFAVPEGSEITPKSTSKRKGELTTPVGQLHLEPRPAPGAGEPSGELVCRFMAELVRARVSDLCLKAPLPSAGWFRFAQGSRVALSLEHYSSRSDLAEKRMLLPPELPIWKPGEYPPGGFGPFTFAAEQGLEKELGLSPDDGKSPDRIAFDNAWDLPLLLVIGDRPFKYLAPGERFVRRSRGSFSYRALGLLGIAENTGQLAPGFEVRLSAQPETYAFGKGKPDESE